MFRSGVICLAIGLSAGEGLACADEPPVNFPKLRLPASGRNQKSGMDSSDVEPAATPRPSKSGNTQSDTKSGTTKYHEGQKNGGQPNKTRAAKAAIGRWTVLLDPTRKLFGIRTLPPQGKLLSPAELEFTGHSPRHPFYLGEYSVDGQFGLVNGGLEKISGQNAVLQLPEMNQFELEGIMEQTGFGGWFVAVGWAQERGYVLSNVTMKESGSPWYLSEMRAASAVPDGTTQLEDLEWMRAQPFRLSVDQNKLTFEVGKKKVADGIPLENYSSGAILIGVYDTRYGPKKLRINSLRVRELPESVMTDETMEVDGLMK